MLFFLFAAPALGATGGLVSSSAVDDGITAGAALGGALIAGGLTLLSGKQSQSAAARALQDTQLRVVRQQAADDIRTLSDLGAKLEKAVSNLLAQAGIDEEARAEALAVCSDLETRVNYIWDDEFRECLRSFVQLARECATASQTGELRARGVEAGQAWKRAKERGGAVWRDLMRAVVQVSEITPPDAQAGAEADAA